MNVGQRGSKGEIYIRCEACGDSKNPLHAHMALYPDGIAHCFRCDYTRRLTIDEMLEAQASGSLDTSDECEDTDTCLKPIVPERFTALDTFIDLDNEGYYVWPERRANGEQVGLHYRSMESKVCMTEGSRGLGFVGSALRSTPSNPLTIVEGPFDVLTSRHVCVFGGLTLGTLKLLRLQSIWLMPDPDWIDSEAKRKGFVHMIEQALRWHSIFIQGVIEADGDADECTKAIHVPLHRLKAWSEGLT